MDVSSFSRERILITLNQSYNFDEEIVAAAKGIAIQKGYLSSFEISSLLEKNEKIKAEKKQANQALDAKVSKKVAQKKEIKGFVKDVVLAYLIVSSLISIWLMIKFQEPVYGIYTVSGLYGSKYFNSKYSKRRIKR